MAYGSRCAPRHPIAGWLVAKEWEGPPLSARTMNASVKYVAELTHVREVSLRGTAEMALWKNRLIGEGLVPAEQDGRAQIMIIAADMTFKGVRFSEVSFSVLVARDEQEAPRDAAFLVQAFNSCRLFAFCERALFSTPYDHGDCRVSTSSPASIRLSTGGQVVFRAEMQDDLTAAGREPSRTGYEGWEGPVFLPTSRRGRGEQGRHFFAKVQGETRSYPFLAAGDAVTIRPSRRTEFLQALIDSRFVGEEWAIREDAAHSKSKTYSRSEWVAGQPPGQAAGQLHGIPW
jgi:hypothetical protein